MSSVVAVFFGYSVIACLHTALAAEPPPVAYWAAGNEECPCIDPWARGLQADPGADGLGCSLIRTSDQHCYNSSYGSQGCQRYDWDATPECARATVKEPWCNALWCFVDGTQCRRAFRPSVFFVNKTISSPLGKQLLVFSYNTCGYVNSFTEEESVEPLLQVASGRPNGKLRVSFPSDSGSGYTVVSPPKVQPFLGVGGTNRSGAFLRFMEDIMSTYAVPWEEHPISDRSHEFSPNSVWTACVHEVAIGNTDMCWGNFWPTATRQRLTSFASTVYADKFYVIVYAHRSDISLATALLKPFTPFTPTLWFTLLFVFGLAGVSMTHQNDERGCQAWRFCCSVPSSVVNGWVAMFTNEVNRVEVRTIGGALAELAIGFSVLVLFTGYTAVVTADLMTQKLGPIENLEEGLQRSYTFCVDANLRELFTAQYPDLEPYLVDSSLTATLDNMDADLCDAAIIHEDLWYGQRTSNYKHCEGTTAKVRLPTVVATVDNTVPVQLELNAALSYAISKEVERGRYVAYQKQGQLEFREPACSEATADGEKTQFTIYDMAGPLIVLGVISVVSPFISCISNRLQRKIKKLEDMLDEDGDGNVSTGEILAATIRRPNSRPDNFIDLDPAPTGVGAPRFRSGTESVGSAFCC